MTLSVVSSGSDDGGFDCDTVIRSVTILGMERKPSAVAVRVSGKDGSKYGDIRDSQSPSSVPKERNSEEFFLYSGASDQTVGFQFKETCSTVTVNSLNLRASVDWQIQIL